MKTIARRLSILTFLVLALTATTMLPAAEPDPLWESARKAYQFRHDETGHLHLKNLMEKQPGNTELAWKCLELMFNKAGRSNVDEYWTLYTSRRLCALERLGAVSASNRTVQLAYEVVLKHLVNQGRLLEAVEMVDRFAKENPHDLHWRIAQAHLYRQIGSRKTAALYDQLKAEMDVDHPHPPSRELWNKFAAEVEVDQFDLPPELQPIPQGSPLNGMAPDDPDGEWALIATRSPRDIAREIERLASKLLAPEAVVPWRDESGLTDPLRALNLHLLHQYRQGKPEDFESLRKLQADRFVQEESESVEVDILALFRRYPWALPAQQRLLEHANRSLLAGHNQAASRSFQDLLAYSADEKVRDAAQVGLWMSKRGASFQLASLLGETDPDKQFTWMGKPTTAREICEQLLENQTQPKPTPTPTLSDLSQHVVHLPPVSPWSMNTPAIVDLSIAGGNLLASGRDLLAMYNAEKPTAPIWSHVQQHHAEENKPGDYHPGYFRPRTVGNTIFTRWGFSSIPQSIAAIDRESGRPLWASETRRTDTKNRRQFKIPVGDPVLNDGLLYYLQWNSHSNINHNQGRNLSLVCFDPQQRSPIWESQLAISKSVNDLHGSMEQASPQQAIFGNRVTIHDGAIYCNSNCGFIARADARDGRADWLYYYRRGSHRAGPMNLGSPPIIAGDWLICMPRDSARVFVLDRHTGRLIWENSLVMGIELVGLAEDTVIVRGLTVLAGLNLKTGEATWYRPLNEPIVGRVQLVGSSIYMAGFDDLLRLDAKTGNVQETRAWNLQNERPRNFAIADKNLYVVTDKPATDPDGDVGPLKSTAPVGPTPLARAWSLPRANATLELPPPDSPLAGTGYVFSSGVLECIDVSAQGGVRWRRFINARSPSMHFVDKKLLLIDRSYGNVGLGNRVLAYNATDGQILWEQLVPTNVGQTFTCGPTQVFHDGRGRIVALNLSNGRRAWERSLGKTNLVRMERDGERLHICFASQTRAAHHLLVDSATGRTVEENVITPEVTGPEHPGNGKPTTDGYYEVKVPEVTARYVRLVALSEINGAGWTSIAEFQVIGSDGKNLPRKNWRVHYVDSFESKSRMDATPPSAIDGDPVTWWHTQWIGGIPRHPHEISFDLGEKKKLTGIRYLPAVIINNNGMIRDYELYVSNDGKQWGEPITKGVLVNRAPIDQAQFVGKTILFESRDRHTRVNRLFQYAMDGKPAKMIEENSRLAFVRGSYYGSYVSKNNKDVLLIRRTDDADYQFELGPTQNADLGGLEIENDRLIMGRRSIIVADLAKKKLLVHPEDESSKKNPRRNQNGILLRGGANQLLKFVHQGNQGQAVFQFDLQTGKQTEFTLTDQTEQFHNQNQHHGKIKRFDKIVVLNDSLNITAWIPSET